MFASMSLVSKIMLGIWNTVGICKTCRRKRDPACTHKDMQYMYIELYKINKYIYIHQHIERSPVQNPKRRENHKHTHTHFSKLFWLLYVAVLGCATQFLPAKRQLKTLNIHGQTTVDKRVIDRLLSAKITEVLQWESANTPNGYCHVRLLNAFELELNSVENMCVSKVGTCNCLKKTCSSSKSWEL